jgi:phage tail sheath protein FI
MPFQLSPGVLIVEKDLSAIIPAVATTSGAYAGAFQWGPVDDVIVVDSENTLAQRFGTPNDTVAPYWFTAANFLGYGNNLQVVRSVDKSQALNAASGSGFLATGVTVTSGGTVATATAFGNANLTVQFTAPDSPVGNLQMAGYATVDAGNLTVDAVVITELGKGYKNQPNVTVLEDGVSVGGTFVVNGADQPPLILNDDHYIANYYSGSAHIYGMWAAKWPGVLGNSIKVSFCDAATWSTWAYRAEFDSTPGTSDYVAAANSSNDEMHIIVIDELGAWTGTRGEVLEKFPFVSKCSDAKRNDGSILYYKEVINQSSDYIWWMDHDELAMTSNASVVTWGTTALAAGTANKPFAFANTITAAQTVTLTGGVSADLPTDGNLMTSFSIFDNDEKFDVSLIPTGPVSNTVKTHVVGIANSRRDCVVFLSPTQTDVVNTNSEASKVVTTRNSLSSSSYAVMDSGWKYQYDRYNDVYRWVPLNGDIAGLCARTDFTDDPWFSPAGLNRGVIRNSVKLAYSPNKTDRDTLYKAGVNPVVTFPGQGTVLFGDKTMLTKPSAFDRINVRRLFIVVEKAIATAAKFQLFEFNDAFTRAQFRTLVEPFLRDVQGRRGITDYRVICDETNNTAEVIDRNEFVADIYIKPTRSINFIQLNFIATRTGISFDEIGA